MTDDGFTGLDPADAPDLAPEPVELDGPLPTDPDSPEEAAEARSEEQMIADRKRLNDAVNLERARRRAKRVLDAEEQADQVAARRLRIVDGWSFLAEEETEEQAIWGDGDRWGWAPGEPLMLFGGNGVFKSTLSHLLVFARLGLIGPDGAPRLDHEHVTADSPIELWGRVLGMPVRPADGSVLYLAGDRPPQIRRAMRRLRRDWMMEVLHDRLVVHEGPLPFEITDSKDALADLADHHKAADVVVDSLKDYCAKPTDDETANGYNRARQECIARGMQWLENHHNRKQQPGQARTNTIEDVYGSRWLSAGTGSVLSMWVEAEGSTLINIRQVKSPSDVLPHLKVEVDKRQGLMIQQAETVSPVTFIRSFGPAGVSAKEFATYYGKSENAARNELNALVGLDQLEVAPTTGRSENGKPVAKRWRTVLGVIPQKVQNIYQQDGLGDF